MLPFQIKQMACGVAVQYKDKTSNWIDKAIQKHGIKVDYWSFSGDFKGMFWKADRTVVVNSNCNSNEKDFVKAYGLGCYLLKENEPFCTKKTISSVEPASIFAKELISFSNEQSA